MKNFTAVPNELLERLMSEKLSPIQHRLLFVIWRYTYGFQRKEHKLSLQFLATATQYDKRQLQRALKDLEDRKFIKQRVVNGRCRIIEVCDFIPQDATIGNSTDGNFTNGISTNPTFEDFTNGTIGNSTNQDINNIKKLKEKHIIIFEYWNSKKIIVHQKISDKLKKEIEKALKKYSEVKIKSAIDNYSIMLKDESYKYCSYTWGLDTFLKHSNGYEKFMDEGEKWINYKNYKDQPRKPEVISTVPI